jgi:hypothetical protein
MRGAMCVLVFFVACSHEMTVPISLVGGCLACVRACGWDPLAVFLFPQTRTRTGNFFFAETTMWEGEGTGHGRGLQATRDWSRQHAGRLGRPWTAAQEQDHTGVKGPR